MWALVLLTQSVVSWSPATTDTAGNPITPAGAEIEVRVRTWLAPGVVSDWTDPVLLLRCEADYALVTNGPGLEVCEPKGSCHVSAE